MRLAVEKLLILMVLKAKAISLKQMSYYWFAWTGIGSFLCIGATQAFLKNGRNQISIPLVDTLTSVFVVGILAPLIFLIAKRSKFSKEHLSATIWAHILALLAFSIVHVVLMENLRFALYPLFEIAVKRWGFWERIAYEFPKDIVTYLVLSIGSYLFFTRKTLLQKLSSSEQRIKIKSDDGVHVIRAASIRRVESCGNYIKVYTDSLTVLTRLTMAKLQSQLDPDKFIRIHRTSIVNVDKIVRLDRLKSGDLELILEDDEKKLRVGRSYRECLRNFREVDAASFSIT